MNRDEAQRVATNHLASYRAKPYAELVGLVGTVQTHQVVAPSGVTYQLEVQAIWDDPKKPNDLLRVMVAVDDGGLRAFAPVTEAFLIGPYDVASNNRWPMSRAPAK